MEKMPENRYQSARGLRLDLEWARAEWRATGRVEPFPLGARDVSDRLKLPQRLYGREAELAALQAVLDETVSSGRPALALISGYAGVGKSGLVHELLRSIEGARGIFLAGKFDAGQRNIPYSTFAQAFRRMLADLLAAGEERQRVWRDRLAEAVGTNGQLIAEIVPETELLLGPQPPLAPLPPIEAEERFRVVFHAFITAFGTAEHPLVLFLDDLQWADLASLKLLRTLLTTPDTRHLLVFGAYRDNEVDASHPLRAAVEQIREAGVRVKEMVLETISVQDLVAFTADAVRRPAEEVRPLARLVYDKTAGNPFFVVQFFQELVRGGLLTFDAGAWRWRWNLARIRDAGYSDDVAAFIVGRIAHLPEATRRVLQLAACVGNTFDLKTLTAVTLAAESSLERELLPAVEQGLLVMTLGRGTYRFAHDRVQQAAYSLVGMTERPALHLKIGRLLLAGTQPEELSERIFEIVNQLMQGRALIVPAERIPFVELALRAARKATAAAAYATARAYLSAGIESLPADGWEAHYELAFALHLEAARATFFAGDPELAQRQLRELHGRARRAQDEAAIATLEVYLLTVRGRLGEAVEVMRSALARYGLSLPLHPAWEEITHKYDAVWRAIGDRTGDRSVAAIDALVELPRAEDPGIVALSDLLAILLLPALFTDENLLALLALTAVELSVHHGLSDATASAAVMVGVVLTGRFGKYEEADAFGRLGRAIVDVRGLSAYRAKVYLDSTLINHWSHPLRSNVGILQEALASARATGNFAVASYALNNRVTAALALGTPLGRRSAPVRGGGAVRPAGGVPDGRGGPDQPAPPGAQPARAHRTPGDVRRRRVRRAGVRGRAGDEPGRQLAGDLLALHPQAAGAVLRGQLRGGLRRLPPRPRAALDLPVVHGDPGVSPLHRPHGGGAPRAAPRRRQARAGRGAGRGAGPLRRLDAVLPGELPAQARAGRRRALSHPWRRARGDEALRGGHSPPLTTPGWCRTRRSPTSWRRSSAGATASRRRPLSTCPRRCAAIGPGGRTGRSRSWNASTNSRRWGDTRSRARTPRRRATSI